MQVGWKGGMFGEAKPDIRNYDESDFTFDDVTRGMVSGVRQEHSTGKTVEGKSYSNRG